MTALGDQTLLAWVSALGGRGATPAGGALALVTLAGAAALAGKIVSIAGNDVGPLGALACSFVRAADEDGAAYERARKGGVTEACACLETELARLEQAVELLATIGTHFDGLRPELAADLAAAGRLARAAAQTLVTNWAVNLAQWAERLSDDAAEPLRAAFGAVTTRLEQA